MKNTSSLLLFTLLFFVSSCNRNTSGVCALKDLPIHGKYFSGGSGDLQATYLVPSGNHVVYALVKNCELYQYKSINRKYGRSDGSTFYGGGLNRDFSSIPDKKYVPKGKNVHVFEFDGKLTGERSGVTCYFVESNQPALETSDVKGDMIIHFW
jgi:hypothetical protein